ncbi:4'-phosphopantetheinyl transferase family protein [Streptomyces angustmyceticus]
MTGAAVTPRIWRSGSPAPPLPDPGSGPHLWLVRAPETEPETETATGGGWPATSVLDEAERRRAAALRRPADRALYTAAHTALRHLLGGYLGIEPSRVPLTRLPCPGCGGPHGRPAVAGAGGGAVHFSLSHSGGLALLGLAARPVGVDIERVPAPRIAEDAARALHPTEQAELADLPAASRPRAFARCWTRKEARLKATGEGLSGGGPRALYLGTGPRPAGLPGWRIDDVQVPEGYAAACAVPR